MNFTDWMLHRGLSQSSVDKYFGAIQGPLSSWAIENQLTAGPLTALSSKSAFAAVALRISALPIFKERNERGHNMYSSSLAKFAEYLSESYGNDLESDIEEILNDELISSTERQELVKCRVGQGKFRQKLLAYWNGCAVTGFKDVNLLVASHIKPWRASSNAERLNPFNGLLLTPNLDKAFDAGLITFGQDGVIVLSPLLTEPEKLGISPDMRIAISEIHEPFLAFHRASVFRSD